MVEATHYCECREIISLLINYWKELKGEKMAYTYVHCNGYESH
jgi:hypothetical protein